MVKKFYSLTKARAALSNNTEFLIAHECNEAYDGGVRTREFFIFKNISEYMAKSNLYPHSHEVIYRDSDEVVTGRLFFDFDYTKTQLRSDFKQVIEKLIFATIEKYYVDISLSAITFVWQNTDYLDKISKHLTVKGFHFDDDWVRQSRVFYDLFELEVKRSEELNYIQEENIIDKQPVRENTTMRMPLNSKLNKPALEFDDDSHTFYDGLIKLYQRDDISNEQSVRSTNYNFENIRIYASDVWKKYFEDEVHDKKIIKNDVKIPHHDEKIKKFIKLKFGNIFEVSKINGSRVDLIRKKPGNCFVDSQNYHENENAYLFYDEDKKIYRFFCRRDCKCNGKKFKEIYPNCIH